MSLHSQCYNNSIKSYYLIRRELPDLLNNPTVIEVAQKYKKAPGQVLLRHILQRGISAIPKSTNADRMKQVI